MNDKEKAIAYISGAITTYSMKKEMGELDNEVSMYDFDGDYNGLKNEIKNKDLVFNALHGKYGEDGFVQSILESVKIPYTHSGVFSSSLAMDKELSRIIFKKKKIRVPKYFVLKQGWEINFNKKIKKSKIKYPIVIKPINEGSSLGVYICKNKAKFKKNYNKLKKKYDKILVEEYIPGKEIQAAVMGDNALGAIELVPKRKFYDYTAKYSSKAKTKHIMPALLSREKYKEALFLAKKAHKLLKCKGITRSDFRFFKNTFYLLETNTQPGMTKLSLVPEIANYCGVKFEDLVVWMAKNASTNR